MRKVVRGAIALVTAAMVMAVTASAALADPYNNGGVAGEQTGGGNLPFTGSDLLLYVVVGIAVIATGFALRAVSARRSLS
jgi:hypothetical protein